MNRTKPTRSNRRSTRRDESVRRRQQRQRGRRMLFEALEERRLLTADLTEITSLLGNFTPLGMATAR